jgi:hypothetical protein
VRYCEKTTYIAVTANAKAKPPMTTATIEATAVMRAQREVARKANDHRLGTREWRRKNQRVVRRYSLFSFGGRGYRAAKSALSL